jgi:hypothetical protein
LRFNRDGGEWNSRRSRSLQWGIDELILRSHETEVTYAEQRQYVETG